MQRAPVSRWPVHVLASVFVVCGLVLGGVAYFHTTRTAHATVARPHFIIARPQYIYAGVARQVKTFPCQTTTPATCYGPQQIRQAYDIQPVLDAGVTGKGRTIVIIDAYQSPTIAHDLKTFDSLFGLNNPRFTIVAPDGLTPFNPSDQLQVGWAGEITLDVEWAHAIAPDAAITLVLAKSGQDQDILSVTRYAIDHNLGDVFSQSYGEGETCVNPTLLKTEHTLFTKAVARGISLFAAAGDTGAAQPTCNNASYFRSVSSPASDPLVTAVGGTQLVANGVSGNYIDETAWNEPQHQAAGGGGFSTLYSSPDYQDNTDGIDGWRGVPDVAYNAGIDSGILGVWSSSGQGQNLVFRFGGTSAGTPQWAGIAALADQASGKRLGSLNPLLYAIGNSSSYSQAFHDILAGNNTFTAQNANGQNVTISGYSAAPGWDPVTGWGSPKVSGLLSLLHTTGSESAFPIAEPVSPAD